MERQVRWGLPELMEPQDLLVQPELVPQVLRVQQEQMEQLVQLAQRVRQEQMALMVRLVLQVQQAQMG